MTTREAMVEATGHPALTASPQWSPATGNRTLQTSGGGRQ
jgi:hypothetical protein